MKTDDIIRAWKDPEYRTSVKDMPALPAGLVELADAALESAKGYQLEASSTNTTGCTVSGVTVNSCGWWCTLTTECTCGSPY